MLKYFNENREWGQGRENMQKKNDNLSEVLQKGNDRRGKTEYELTKNFTMKIL